MSRLKVLFALPFTPVPPDFGGALRVYHLVKQVALRHHVSAVCYGTAEDAERLRSELSLEEVVMVPPTWKAAHRRLGQLWSTFTDKSFFQLSVLSRDFQRALDAMLSRGRFDVVQTEFSHLGPFALNTTALKVLDTHNVEYDNFHRMWQTSPLGVKKLHYGLEYRKMRAAELDWCARQDVVLATSERDVQLLDRDVPSVPKHVVPNGVDSDFFTPAPAGTEVEPFTLAFTGMMAYVPNHDGIKWFLDQVFPLVLKRVPQAKLYVVGKSPPPHIVQRESAHVRVTGTVPDVRPYVWRAAAYVVPLRMGGGTRLKIAEALAMKKPLVSTRVGCEGIALVDGESALLADEPQPFADAVVRLLEDPALGARLAEQGRQLATTNYDWRSIGERLEQIYRSHLGARERSA